MTTWYRQQLKERIPKLIEKWQIIIGVQLSAWKVRQMKTRWELAGEKPSEFGSILSWLKSPLTAWSSFAPKVRFDHKV